MAAHVDLEVGDRTVRITNPDRVYFPARGETKLDLARYYLSVGDGAAPPLGERPCMLPRLPRGVGGGRGRQRRVSRGATARAESGWACRQAQGRRADGLWVSELASVIWAVHMSPVQS